MSGDTGDKSADELNDELSATLKKLDQCMRIARAIDAAEVLASEGTRIELSWDGRLWSGRWTHERDGAEIAAANSTGCGSFGTTESWDEA